jgi:3-oxoacyl-[acyl-carrier-protein] synthase-3
LPEPPSELPSDGAWEAEAGLVDPEGLIATATGARRSRPSGRAGLASIAAELPAQVVDNERIAGPLGLDSEWITSRTGVRERRRANEETLVDLAAGAGARALALSGTEPAELDLVLVATFTPDELQPHAAPLVADRLGAAAAGSVDVGAACTGFLSALSLAAAQVEAGRAQAALIVGAEVLSQVVDYTDRRTAGLFGDGAGAAVITAGGPGRIGEIVLRADGSRSRLITASHQERLLRMEGRATFRAAVAAISATSREVVSDAGLSLDEIDLFVFHQANSRIISAVGERLELPPDRVVDCIERFGNTSAASIPIALAQAAVEGRLQRGSRVLFGAFGAGLTWGAGIVEWEGRT